MKKLLAALLLLTGFSLAAQAEKLEVAATAVPHAELLEFIKPALAEEGIDLQVRVFTDYVQPNVQVSEGRLDANFFQHQPYLNEYNRSRDANLVSLAGIHVEPFGAYSNRHDSLDALPEGAQVVLPNDATNGGRALLLLQEAGLIEIAEEAGITATPRDIVSNPKNLRFRELEAATLPRVLGQVDLALINTNYALEAGLNPTQDALVLEGPASPYVNILVSREDRQDDERLQKLVTALQSDAVKAFIEENYKGAVVPAF
ncbi:MetQ/NlpA family ABC transporter substrate-binding protein [Marinospirillum perlucidum]|uniref:MetQ/NlpA family ABC transporter substrate-binding protein n=1 Tax=Marinospirillum perlucidum TaxID=1982602 RepID=UPI000DF46DB4|nr:MetQ/NlpA family ABC transporter substrate-binding protein [Marinospirillum perlucidum]